MRYSPKPIEEYFIPGVSFCGIRRIGTNEACSDEIWNLYWLSEPLTDVLPGFSGPLTDLLRIGRDNVTAVIQDVLEDYHLAQALSWSPSRFLDSSFC